MVSGGRFRGLCPHEPATVRLHMSNGSNLEYLSSITYPPVGEEGTLDLEEAKPVEGGSLIPAHKYGGAMDLFRIMKAVKGGAAAQRFWSADVTRPYRCTLSVHQGESDAPLSAVEFDRLLLSDDVRRVDVREGRVVATLFLPSAATAGSPKPCIITIHGGHNRRRIVEDNAALLASRLGFPTVALPFFGVEGLPPKLFEGDIDVSYFEEAVDLFLSMEEVRADVGVGLWGISKGAEVCLSMSSFLGDKIRAAVIVNSVLKPGVVAFAYKGQRHEPQQVKVSSRPKAIRDDLMSFSDIDSGFLDKDDKIIPFHKSPADLLFVGGCDDRLHRSCRHVDLAREILTKHGKNNFEVLKYAGLGHLLDLPYAPVTCESFHGLVPPPKMLDMGGRDLAEHSFAQEDSWRKILEFYSSRLQQSCQPCS